MKISQFIIVLGLCICSACYSFKGTSIAPDIKSYYVEDFSLDRNKSDNYPSNIEITFAEALRERIRNESSLKYDQENPDIIFSGMINTYRTSPAAPLEGSTTALNRLDIAVRVEFEDLTNEENNWSKSYSGFEDFASTEALSSVEEGLIGIIFEDMTERIFNDSFSNW